MFADGCGADLNRTDLCRCCETRFFYLVITHQMIHAEFQSPWKKLFMNFWLKINHTV